MARAVDALGRLECKNCGEMKHDTEFHKHSRNSTGFHIWCKKCSYARRKAKELESGKRFLDRQYMFNKRYPDDAELFAFLRERFPTADWDEVEKNI